MCGAKQRKAAIETFVRFDHGFADTIAGLGRPSGVTLRTWWKEHEKAGRPPARRKRGPAFSARQVRTAVAYYLEHGKSLSRTRRALGHPKVTYNFLRTLTAE